MLEADGSVASSTRSRAGGRTRLEKRGEQTSSSVAGASPLMDLAMSRSNSLSCSALTAAEARLLASNISLRRSAAFSVRSRKPSCMNWPNSPTFS